MCGQATAARARIPANPEIAAAEFAAMRQDRLAGESVDRLQVILADLAFQDGRPVFAILPGERLADQQAGIVPGVALHLLEPALGQGQCRLATRIRGQQPAGLAVEGPPFGRRSLFVAGALFDPRLFAEVLLHTLETVLHIDHLDDSLEKGGSGRFSGFDGSLGGADGAQRAVEPTLLLFERGDLQPQRLSQFDAAPVKHLADLPERQPQKPQRHDLLQPLEISLAVQPIPRLAAPRPQQSEAIVMVERLHRDAGQPGEFMNAVRPGQSPPTPISSTLPQGWSQGEYISIRRRAGIERRMISI
jgi:hypothetical protein